MLLRSIKCAPCLEQKDLTKKDILSELKVLEIYLQVLDGKDPLVIAKDHF